MSQKGGKQSFRENACRGVSRPKHAFIGGPTDRREGGKQSFFHAYQMLEAGVCQFANVGRHPRGPAHLIAVARYLATQSPTERAVLQTTDIARRLMRGAKLYHDATARDNSRLITLTLGYFAPDGPGYAASSV